MIYIYIYIYLYRERERERDRERGCVFERKREGGERGEKETARECVCARERVSFCVRERGTVCKSCCTGAAMQI